LDIYQGLTGKPKRRTMEKRISNQTGRFVTSGLAEPIKKKTG